MSRRGRRHLPTETRNAGRSISRWTAIASLVIAATWLVPGWHGRGDRDHGAAAAAEAAGDASPKAVKESLDAAQKMLEDGMPKKAAAQLAEAAAMIERLAGQPKQPSGLRALWERCRSLRSDVELEGIDVSGIELAPLKSASTKPAGGADEQKPMAAGKPQPKTAPRNAPAAGRQRGADPLASLRRLPHRRPQGGLSDDLLCRTHEDRRGAAGRRRGQPPRRGDPQR
jgi:hypothetical protein